MYEGTCDNYGEVEGIEEEKVCSLNVLTDNSARIGRPLPEQTERENLFF
jgi:hypothetical protein